MYSHELSGRYHDLGVQYGQSVPETAFSEPSPDVTAFLDECRPYLRQHVPELLAELRGLQSAANVSLKSVLSVPVALPNDSQCSAVAIVPRHTASDSLLFGRNYDYYSTVKQHVQMFRTRPADGYASIGFSDHWVGRHDGMNDAGLAVAITWVANDGYEPGVTFSLATRHILDTFRRVEDAVDFLEKIPHARNTNFLIADANSNIAIVEAGPAGTAIRYPEHGIGTITNHFTTSLMQQYERKSYRPEDTKARYQILEQLTQSNSGIQEKDLQQVLADPDDGVCAHDASAGPSNIITLWSYTAFLGSREIQLCDSLPTEISYEQVAF